ncbi:MAG: hypothetical protein JW927_18840, partial [Deltaproteobacteria bacterium]|nr:hypothetical protein [Deltaproteobacteria bacterium]
MNLRNKILLVIVVSWFLSSGIYAEETAQNASADNDLKEYILPQITVIGDTSMGSLERDVIEAHELKYKVFNNLNSTDEFDITCGWTERINTRIKDWTCDVGYIKTAREDAVRDFVEKGIPMPSDGVLLVNYAHKGRALNREMRALASKHPEMAIAIINAYELEELYNEEVIKRYKDSILVVDPPKPDLKLNKIDIWEAAFQDHKKGILSDEAWARWDTMYRKIFKLPSYQNLWTSV